MPEVNGPDCVSAWKQAVAYVRGSHGEAFNLVVTIEQPTVIVDAWMEVYNPRSLHPGADDIRDVVNTIFHTSWPAGATPARSYTDHIYARTNGGDIFLEIVGPGALIFSG